MKIVKNSLTHMHVEISEGDTICESEDDDHIVS
jgi:hypothetical protein